MIKSQNYILDFTHVYKDEDIEKIDDINWIDCSDIAGCDLYCSGWHGRRLKKEPKNMEFVESILLIQVIIIM